jgi:hypothetical protein
MKTASRPLLRLWCATGKIGCILNPAKRLAPDFFFQAQVYRPDGRLDTAPDRPFVERLTYFLDSVPYEVWSAPLRVAFSMAKKRQTW